MKKAMFDELLESAKQASEIAHGARKAPRVFEVNAKTSDRKRPQ